MYDWVLDRDMRFYYNLVNNKECSENSIVTYSLGTSTALLGRKLRMCEMVIVRYTITLHDMRHIYRLYRCSNPWNCTRIYNAKSRKVFCDVRPNGIVRPYAKKHLAYGTTYQDQKNILYFENIWKLSSIDGHHKNGTIQERDFENVVGDLRLSRL